MAFVFLNKICTFVVTKSFKRNLKLYFFNDKGLSAKGSNSERLVHQFLELLVNPKVAVPHTNLFLMTKEKQFVTDSENAKVTPAQQNQITFNQLVVNYVKHRLAYKHLFTTPVKPGYMAIYNQSLNSTAL